MGDRHRRLFHFERAFFRNLGRGGYNSLLNGAGLPAVAPEMPRR